MKDNEHILSDQQAFLGAYQRARETFGKIDGVVDVGFGQKKTSGRYRDAIAIVVFVREKKAEEELSPEQHIPQTFEGYPTDVRIVRQAGFDVCENTGEYDKVQGGIQISSPINAQTGLFERGTLGCIVKRRGDSGRENVYLLSNKHVLYANGTRAEDYIYHPFPPSPDTSKFQAPGPSHTLGPIQPASFYGDVPFTVPGNATPVNCFVDCAIARIDIDSKCCDSTCTKDVIECSESIIDLQVNGVNTISDVRSVINDPSIIGKKVFKVGRTTSKTIGIVRLINAPVTAPPDPSNPGGPQVSGCNTIEIDIDPTSVDPTSQKKGINCKGNARFTEKGDSGAVVLDEQGRVIGLHSLGSSPGDPTTSPSNACHILPVLDNLGICIPTTSGTSHGSSRATDGSGIAPLAESVSGPAISDERGANGMQDEDAVLARSSGFSEPPPVTDEEVRRLHELRGAFRTTRKGRELHAVFAQVRREIGYLVRNCRPVKVAWHRNKGPAFLAHMLNHLKSQEDQMPDEVDGVSLSTLLMRMGEVLSLHGSRPLRASIEQHGDDLMAMLASGNRAQDYIAYLQRRESA